MAEIGMPKIAARTRAPMYALERITASGSIAGAPPADAVAAGWLTLAAPALGGLFESAIRLGLSSRRSIKGGTVRTEESRPIAGGGANTGLSQRTTQIPCHISPATGDQSQPAEMQP